MKGLRAALAGIWDDPISPRRNANRHKSDQAQTMPLLDANVIQSSSRNILYTVL